MVLQSKHLNAQQRRHGNNNNNSANADYNPSLFDLYLYKIMEIEGGRPTAQYTQTGNLMYTKRSH